MEWSEKVVESFARLSCNIRLDVAAQIEDLIKNAGFLNVHRKRFRWYLRARTNNQQAKTLSHNVHETLLGGLDKYSRRPFLEGLSQSRKQYDVSMMGVRSAIENEATSVYIAVNVLYAKKPDLDDSGHHSEDRQPKEN